VALPSRVFVWVILFLMAGWLNEVGLSMLTHFAGEPAP
jgi:hypothetical protein